MIQYNLIFYCNCFNKSACRRTLNIHHINYYFYNFLYSEDQILIVQLCGDKAKTARIDAFDDVFKELEKGNVNW